jgi:hypothetical protein
MLTLNQELGLLLRRYGKQAVKQELQKLTRGRPPVPVAARIDDLFQIWLTVEIFLRRNPNTRVTAACESLAEMVSRVRNKEPRHGKAKYEKKIIPEKSEAIRRKYTTAKRLLADDPRLRHAWQWQLEAVCGGALPRRDPNLEFQEAYRNQERSWAKTNGLFPL